LKQKRRHRPFVWQPTIERSVPGLCRNKSDLQGEEEREKKERKKRERDRGDLAEFSDESLADPLPCEKRAKEGAKREKEGRGRHKRKREPGRWAKEKKGARGASPIALPCRE